MSQILPRPSPASARVGERCYGPPSPRRAPIPRWCAVAVDDLALRGDMVHVWAATLDPASSSDESLKHVLSPDERARADGLRHEVDRRRFVLARALLRRILAGYLRDEPARLEFHYNPYGKPFLAIGGRPHDLRFNVSHSNGISLY